MDPGPTGDTIMNHIEAAADLFAINAEIKKLEDSAKVLKEMLKEYGSFTDSGYSVSVKSSERTTVDPKILRDKYPEIVEMVSRVSQVVSVSVKKV
nr:MAG: hypothetical protein [Caudoviricetes sp.]